MSPHSPEPRISVVIPAHNAGDVLGSQLEALSHQDVDLPYEVVVAVNRCTDHTERVVADWSRRDSRMRLIGADERAGASYARNVGSRAAVGGLLLYCDADDVVSAQWVRHMVDGLERAEVLGGRMEVLESGPHPRGAGGAPNNTGLMRCNEVFVAASCAVGCRREVFDAIGGWDETYPHGFDDVVFCLHAARAGYRIGFSEDAVAGYRLRGSFVQVLRQRASYGRGEASFIRREQPWVYRGLTVALLSLLRQVLRLADPRMSLVSRADHVARIRRIASKTRSLLADPPPRSSRRRMRRWRDLDAPIVDVTIPIDQPIVGGLTYVAPIGTAQQLISRPDPHHILQILGSVVDGGSTVLDVTSQLDVCLFSWQQLLGPTSRLVIATTERLDPLIRSNMDRHCPAGAFRVCSVPELNASLDELAPFDIIRLNDDGREPEWLARLQHGQHIRAGGVLMLFFHPEKLRAAGRAPSDFFAELTRLGDVRVSSPDRQASGHEWLLADSVPTRECVLLVTLSSTT